MSAGRRDVGAGCRAVRRAAAPLRWLVLDSVFDICQIASVLALMTDEEVKQFNVHRATCTVRDPDGRVWRLQARRKPNA
ncbi:hypothetical protein [Burkholderia sp. IMCC1007]|uniref:hypothetical protein n=1 Tax=Burkholderia sp. IMCC1007 TaxID=3004104 RepID=UPI0022B2F1EA|nr:hypothetical protein [Burkholderia sp. IMCC1007]